MSDISSELITKAVQGDMKAFEEIYRATAGFVYNVALRITNNRDDADEVTQDVFVSVHRNLKNFAFRSSFKTWVYRIAANTAINHCKRSSRLTERQVEYDPAIHDIGKASEMSDKVNKEQSAHIVEALLSVLDPDQRACIVLREIQGFDYREIADTLHININTVRSRLKRAREKLLTFGGKG